MRDSVKINRFTLRAVVALMLVTTASFAGPDADKVVLQVQGDNLEKYLVAGKVTLVDFYADWCGPCRYIGPILENMARSDAAVVLRKVNVDRNQALAQKYGVRAIPRILIFDKHGKLAGTVVGADRDKVAQYVKQAKD